MIFNFHGYPSAIHQLIHRRPSQERFHVRGYAEEGTTTTPVRPAGDERRRPLPARRSRRCSRVDIEASRDSVRGHVRGVRRAVDPGRAGRDRRSCRRSCEEHRAYIREHGNDPPEILDWTWSRERRGRVLSGIGFGAQPLHHGDGAAQRQVRRRARARWSCSRRASSGSASSGRSWPPAARPTPRSS